MMAKFLNYLTKPHYQQIRYLPRFNQHFPEKEPTIISSNEIPIISENSAPECPSSIPEDSKKQKPLQKRINFKLNSLVIPQNNQHETKQTQKRKENSPPQSITDKLIKAASYERGPTTDAEGNVIYTKMHDNDSRIIKIMSSIKSSRRNNKASGNHQPLILLEGIRLIKEAMQSECELEYLLFSRREEIDELKPYLPKLGRIYKMPYKEMQTWSDLTTNPGIMGVFQVPSANFFEPKDPLPLTVICDSIREPNNLGAILRTASGVGCAQIILSKGCVNVWDSKVLRSSCGAHFHLKITKDVSLESLHTLLPKDANIFIADNNLIISSSGDTPLDSDGDGNNFIKNLPILSYSAVNYNLAKHIVLIIGGETEGISENSFKLAQQFSGCRINIPMNNGIESLNSGTALGIIAFEIKRQLIKIDDNV